MIMQGGSDNFLICKRESINLYFRNGGMYKMDNYDVIVIGGGPAGMVTAMTVRKQHKDKSILMIKDALKGVVPCGIPYVFHELDDINKNAMGPKPFVDMGGKLLIDQVKRIDMEERTVEVASGTKIGFEKLVLATGSKPLVPTFIPGSDFAEGVGYVSKSYDGVLELKKKIDSVSKIVILGSGFTAVELAEQLAQEVGKEVHLVYRAEHCLHRSFSSEYAKRVDESLEKVGVLLHSRCQIAEITGKDGKATGIKFEDGETMEADFVIVAMGYRSCGELAEEAGINVNKNGAIIVDNYLRTSAEDVFAVGDCAQTVGFITGRGSDIMLASTGAAEARILGYNLYSMRIMRNFPGTLSVFSTEIAGQALASAGATEAQTRTAGIDIVVGQFQDVDRHPGTLSGVSSLGARLIVSAGDGQIIGGELFGGKSVGEMINILALAIQKKITVYEFISFQLGTHPKLTAAPTKPILIKAAEQALEQL